MTASHVLPIDRFFRNNICPLFCLGQIELPLSEVNYVCPRFHSMNPEIDKQLMLFPSSINDRYNDFRVRFVCRI